MRSRRSPVQVFRDLRMPSDERRAAKAEREAEAKLRKERDSTLEAERLAAAKAADGAVPSPHWFKGVVSCVIEDGVKRFRRRRPSTAAPVTPHSDDFLGDRNLEHVVKACRRRRRGAVGRFQCGDSARVRLGARATLGVDGQLVVDPIQILDKKAKCRRAHLVRGPTIRCARGTSASARWFDRSMSAFEVSRIELPDFGLKEGGYGASPSSVLSWTARTRASRPGGTCSAKACRSQ